MVCSHVFLSSKRFSQQKSLRILTYRCCLKNINYLNVSYFLPLLQFCILIKTSLEEIQSDRKEYNITQKSPIFWGLTPCSPLKVSQRFGGTYRLHLLGWRVSQAGSKQLKMEARFSSETSGGFQWTTWCYIPENRTQTLQILHNQRNCVKWGSVDGEY
jgi:hypothetical protein